MFDQNLAQPDLLGLGFEVDSDLRVIGKEGAQADLFAIGNLTKGRIWEVTAIPDIRRQALELALTLLHPPEPF